MTREYCEHFWPLFNDDGEPNPDPCPACNAACKNTMSEAEGDELISAIQLVIDAAGAVDQWFFKEDALWVELEKDELIRADRSVCALHMALGHLRRIQNQEQEKEGREE